MLSNVRNDFRQPLRIPLPPHCHQTPHPENCRAGSEPVWGREHEGGGNGVTNLSLTIPNFII